MHNSFVCQLVEWEEISSSVFFYEPLLLFFLVQEAVDKIYCVEKEKTYLTGQRSR